MHQNIPPCPAGFGVDQRQCRVCGAGAPTLEGAMDRLNTHVLDFLGAGPGGVLRHALGAYPFVTRIINITGSMAMGFLIGCLALTRSV
jgi:hypothetical protein